VPRNREVHWRQEANNAERNQFNWLCNTSDDRAGSTRGERARSFFASPAELPASFCSFSSSPRRVFAAEVQMDVAALDLDMPIRNVVRP
jgi:hypothetical protein